MREYHFEDTEDIPKNAVHKGQFDMRPHGTAVSICSGGCSGAARGVGNADQNEGSVLYHGMKGREDGYSLPLFCAENQFCLGIIRLSISEKITILDLVQANRSAAKNYRLFELSGF